MRPILPAVESYYTLKSGYTYHDASKHRQNLSQYIKRTAREQVITGVQAALGPKN